MSIYTNTGLVKHAENALKLKTKYMWGGILREITESYINMLRGTYGISAGTGYTEKRYKELEALAGKGWYGVDCVGLIKSYYWSGKADGGTGSPRYGAAGCPDVNANFMYQQARVKGRIGTMPEVPGLIVYSRTNPHVGIYIGGGYTIESTLGSRGDGVVKRKLDSFWEYWFECPYIDYPDNAQTATDSGKPTDIVYRAISTAAIRAGMSKNSAMYSRATKGYYYPADKIYDNWFRHAGQNAFSMLKDGTELFVETGKYDKLITTEKLNVRTKPSISADKFTTLNKGEKVYAFKGEDVLSDGREWKRIVLGGKLYYVAAEYVK